MEDEKNVIQLREEMQVEQAYDDLKDEGEAYQRKACSSPRQLRHASLVNCATRR